MEITSSFRRKMVNIYTQNRILVICDKDRDYAKRLADYLRKIECGYEIVIYTEPQAFVSGMNGRKAGLMLIQEGFMDEVDRLLTEEGKELSTDVDRKYILTEDRNAVSNDGNTIYKYQSAAVIVGILGEDIEVKHRIVNDARRHEGICLTGIYSPVNHTLKTTFAIALGQILSEDREVLYINFEGYNGLSCLLDLKSEYNMQDLLYEYSLDPGVLANKIMQYTEKADGLNMLIPVRSPYELQEIEPSLWLSFISSLTSLGKYEVIILDISDTVRGVMQLLNVCSNIYMPLRKDSFSLAKLKDFDDTLARYPDCEMILNKLNKLKFPYFDDIDGTLNKLKSSRLGKYIRSEICT